MLGVLQGFAVILGVIGAGYLAALFGVVRGDERRVLGNTAFYVATPALLFVVLQRADPGVIFSPVILVTTLSAVVVAGLFVVASQLWFRRDLADSTLAATSAGYVNSGNLGLPVALYILGDAAYVAPVILMQVLVYAPVILTILETTRGNRRGVGLALTRAASNLIIIASILGLACALLDLKVPALILEPIDMLGAAAVPLVLLSFGASLRGQRALQPGTGRAAVFTAAGLKILLMPLLAWALCRVLGLSAHETFVATTIAALPTAQNVYNYAATYRRAETMVRDTVFLTTFASLPAIALVAWGLGG